MLFIKFHGFFYACREIRRWTFFPFLYLVRRWERVVSRFALINNYDKKVQNKCFDRLCLVFLHWKVHWLQTISFNIQNWSAKMKKKKKSQITSFRNYFKWFWFHSHASEWNVSNGTGVIFPLCVGWNMSFLCRLWKHFSPAKQAEISLLLLTATTTTKKRKPNTNTQFQFRWPLTSRSSFSIYVIVISDYFQRYRNNRYNGHE